MKTLFKKSTLVMFALFLGTAFYGFANVNPENLLTPVEKEGKYAKLDISSLPADTPVLVRVRDDAERLVYEFNVTNRGQKEVLVNFNRLKPGLYSLNILRGENDVVRKVLNIYWDQVVVDNVVVMSKDRGQETRWPLYMVR